MRGLQGRAASAGVARGPWVRIDPRPSVVGKEIRPEQVAGELERLPRAADEAADELEQLAAQLRSDGHEDEAAIFDAQAMIARDPALITLAEAQVRDAHRDAVAAIQDAAAQFADQLRALGDELLSARAADVVDVGSRIAGRLAGVAPGTVALEHPAIVVADDLPPSTTATLPRERLLGLALEGSSPTAHAAILARAYGIPAVVQAQGLLAALDGAADAHLAVDGTSGEVVIAPDEATAADFDARGAAVRARHDRDLRQAALPTTTADGAGVMLLANIGTPDEAESARAMGAHGVGLFRTEFLFLERAHAPSEREQEEAYRRVVEVFAPDPVTIRLLDVGGDKPIPYLPIPAEPNPFLGVRALRLARERPDLFFTQLRACYRAATAGRVLVMAPMIADAGDARLLVNLAGHARAQLAAEGVEAGDVELGVMLEIPSAILVADSYFDRLAFASLGTNDLLQYALAVDRGNPALEPYRDVLHPAVLQLVRLAVEAAERNGIELSVCGEMAADPAAALALAGLGIRKLSMASSSLPAVRRAIRSADLGTLENAARDALGDASAADVRGRFEALLPPDDGVE